jgi:hypothetical protein
MRDNIIRYFPRAQVLPWIPTDRDRIVLFYNCPPGPPGALKRC